MELQDSVQRSLQNPAEKILQISTESQRSKTWELREERTLQEGMQVKDGTIHIRTRHPLSAGIFPAKNLTHQPGFEPTTS